MNEERDVIGEVIAEDKARPIHPAVAEYAVAALHTATSDGERVAELELLNAELWRQNEALLSEIRSIQEDPETYLRRLAHAKSTLEPEQPSGVLLPERATDANVSELLKAIGWMSDEDAKADAITVFNYALDEVARLNAGSAVPDSFLAAARRADDVLTAITRNNAPLATLERTYGKDWGRAIDAIRKDLILQIAASPTTKKEG